VLEHLPDYKPAVQEIVRVLNDDGYAVVSVPNWDCYDSLEGNIGIVTSILRAVNTMLRFLGRPQIFSYGVNPHFHKMFPWQWKRNLESLGLDVVEDRASYLSPYIPKFRFIERFIFKIPGLFSLKTWIDDVINGIPPFKYFGIAHIFLCRKRNVLSHDSLPPNKSGAPKGL